MPVRWLRADLATGTASTIEVDFPGGSIAALRLLADALHGGQLADPPTMLVTGPLAGAPAPGVAVCAAVGVSPLSCAVAETRAEGPFAAALAGTGVGGLVLSGQAGQPVYLLVRDGMAALHDAADLWGLSTTDTTAVLTDRHGPGATVAAIGPAGEAGVPYATVVAGGVPLPRLGFGADWGCRGLKAVVCVGGRSPRVADAAPLAALAEWYAAEVPTSPLTAWQHAPPGFGAWPGTVTDPGYASLRNFSDTRSMPGAGLRPERFPPVARSGACPACPTDCLKWYEGAPLHQEAVAMLGANLGIDHLDVVLRANALCVSLGLDPVSLGGALGCLFETEDRFGDAAALLALVAAVGRGDHPASGGAAALGGPAMVSKRVELPPFDPRVQPGLGLGYAVAPVGPRYDIVEHDLDFDPELGLPSCFPEARRIGVAAPVPLGTLDPDRAARLLELWSGLDALGVCPYAATPTRPLTLDRVTALVRAVTGAEVDVLALGARRLRLQFAINAALGVDAAADTLPDRFFTEPVASGRHAGAVLDRGGFAAATAALRRRYTEGDGDG